MNPEKIDHLQLVIITGMSGAGKTVAVQCFEDLGYFCIDNMPPSLIPKFWELIKESGKVTQIALVIDMRSRNFFREIQDMLVEIENTDIIDTKLLFLDASANIESLLGLFKSEFLIVGYSCIILNKSNRVIPSSFMCCNACLIKYPVP